MSLVPAKPLPDKVGRQSDEQQFLGSGLLETSAFTTANRAAKKTMFVSPFVCLFICRWPLAVHNNATRTSGRKLHKLPTSRPNWRVVADQEAAHRNVVFDLVLLFSRSKGVSQTGQQERERDR